MKDATKVPPRRTWAKTVMASTTHGDEPRAALPAPDAAGHHDHRDAGDRGEGGGRLGDAEGKDRLDVVEATAQRRRRGDDDVDQAVEEQQSAGPTSNRSLSALLLQAFER